MLPPKDGRGAQSNPAGRFEPQQLEEIDLDPADLVDDPLDGLATAAPRPVRTRFYRDKSRSVVTENDSPDVGFTHGVNPYRGCEHGCIYCYARPTHEYLGFSAGLDFESRIMVKEDAPELLRKKLSRPGWKPVAITFSGNTDCYQPVERKLGITRRCLEALRDFRNPFMTISKNHLVTRDIDVIGEMAALGAAASLVTVTSLDADLCGILEPRTSRPAFRLRAIEELSRAGIPVGVMVAPIIPGLTDCEVPKILAAAAEAGARFAAYTIVRLPHGVAPLFAEWLGVHFPERKEKVLSLIRGMRDGRLNDPEFGSRMRGEGPYAEQIRALFKLHSRRLGLERGFAELSTAHFRQPPGPQLSLF